MSLRLWQDKILCEDLLLLGCFRPYPPPYIRIELFSYSKVKDNRNSLNPLGLVLLFDIAPS